MPIYVIADHKSTTPYTRREYAYLSRVLEAMAIQHYNEGYFLLAVR